MRTRVFEKSRSRYPSKHIHLMFLRSIQYVYYYYVFDIEPLPRDGTHVLVYYV